MVRTSFCLILALTFATTAFAQTKRPNVLFIAVDDLNLSIGAYGHPLAKTPNLDRLASRGVRFDLAYCQYPLCNPSRVSMLTGLRPDSTNVHDLQTNFRSTRPDAITLPQLFKQNGYFVARSGKIFHYGVPREIGTPGMDDPISWEQTYNPKGRDKIEEDQLKVLTRGTGSTTIGFAMAWREQPGTDEEQTDGLGVAKAIEWLEESSKSDRPFFIGMGFYRPHTPFVATKKWFDMYPKESIQLPKFDADELKDIPPIAFHVRRPNYALPESDLKDCLRAYLASVSCLDAQVGQLMEALDRFKLADNTIVVFFSDHGYLVGEHGQWQKQLLFDQSPRVPLIIFDPRPNIRGNGKPSPRPVELLDVYPTIRELCDLPSPPQKLEGHSLVPLLNDPNAPWDHPAYSQVSRRVGQGEAGKDIMGYSVRTERWRYTEWGEDGAHGRELYDHSVDPGELTNLANDPKHADDVKQLAVQLEKIR